MGCYASSTLPVVGQHYDALDTTRSKHGQWCTGTLVDIIDGKYVMQIDDADTHEGKPHVPCQVLCTRLEAPATRVKPSTLLPLDHYVFLKNGTDVQVWRVFAHRRSTHTRPWDVILVSCIERKDSTLLYRSIRCVDASLYTVLPHATVDMLAAFKVVRERGTVCEVKEEEEEGESQWREASIVDVQPTECTVQFDNGRRRRLPMTTFDIAPKNSHCISSPRDADFFFVHEALTAPHSLLAFSFSEVSGGSEPTP